MDQQSSTILRYISGLRFFLLLELVAFAVKIHFFFLIFSEPTLNFLLNCLSQKGLGSAASNALQNICAACPEHMASHFQGLMQIARSLDNFAISSDAAINLLKGME